MRMGVVGVAETDTVSAQHGWQTGPAGHRQARLQLSAHRARSVLRIVEAKETQILSAVGR